MRKRINKSEIFKKIHELDKQIRCINMKIKFQDNLRPHYFNSKYKTPILDFVTQKAGVENKYTSLVYQKNRELSRKFNKSYERWFEVRRTLTKERSKLISKWRTLKGKKNKSLIKKSLNELIMEGSSDKMKDFSYCTKTGREVIINFTMFKRIQKNKWLKTISKERPETFYDIAMLKIQEYKFDSHFDKLSTGNVITNSPNTTSKRGILWKSSRPGASEEIKNAAAKLRQKMTNSIFCTYLGSTAVRPFKIKDIFIFDAPPKINKKKRKKEKELLKSKISETLGVVCNKTKS